MDIQETAQQELKQSRRRRFMRRGLSSLDLAMLTRQLATLLRSGLPLEETLQAVASKPRSRACSESCSASAARSLRTSVGRRLRDFPQAFPEIYRATVSAGEQSGKLDQVLERLSDYTESRQVMGNRSAMPWFIPLFCWCCRSGSFRSCWPTWCRRWWPYLNRATRNCGCHARPHRHERFDSPLLVLCLDRRRAAVWGFQRWLKAPEARLRFDRFLLRVPVVGKLIRGLNTGRFSRTFSILTASAVPVLEALRISPR